MTSRLFAIIATVLTILVFGAAGCLLGPLLPAIAADFKVPQEIAGLLFAFNFFGSIIAVLVGGYLADRFGKKLLFLCTLGCLVLSYALIARVPTFPLLALACLLAGAMGGTLEGLCGAIIADLDPTRVNRNMNLLQVVFSVGAVGGIVVAALLGKGVDWRMAYTVLAYAAGAVWLLGVFMYVPPVHSEERMSLQVARRICCDGVIIGLAIAIALYVGSEMSLAWWISPLLKDNYGYQPAAALMGAAVFWATMGVGRVISSMLCHHYPGARVLGWHIAGGLIAYAVLLFAPGPWSLWIGAGVAGFTFSGIWPLIVALGSSRYPAYSGTVVALLVASGTLGGAIFPSLTGFVFKRFPAFFGITPQSWGIVLIAGLFVLLAVVTRISATRQANAEQCQPSSSITVD
ncbi:MAG: MFS transporter [Armatimonadota bacterium]